MSGGSSEWKRKRREFSLEGVEWVQRAEEGGAALLGEGDCVSLILVFQVNCPGCFMHALPLAQKMREWAIDHNATITAAPSPTTTTTAASGDGVEGLSGSKSGKATVKVALIATAFEDHEYNNKESLEGLLNRGEVVGETRKYYKSLMAESGGGGDGGGVGVGVGGSGGGGGGRGVGTGARQKEDEDEDDEAAALQVTCPLNLSQFPVGWDSVRPVTEADRVALAETLRRELSGRAPPAQLEFAINREVNSRKFAAPLFDRYTLQGTPTWLAIDRKARIATQYTGHLNERQLVELLTALASEDK